MEEWQREALHRHRSEILNDLDVTWVADHLIAQGILDAHHVNVISETLGRRERAKYLLDLLPLRGPLAYDEFIASLQKPYNWLARSLAQERKNSAIIQESKSTALSSDHTSDKYEKVDIHSDAFRTLCFLSSLASECGKALFAILETQEVVRKAIKPVGYISNDPSFVAENNCTTGEETQILARLKGGCDLGVEIRDGNESVTTEMELNVEQNDNSANTNEMQKEPVLPINSPDSGVISEEMGGFCLGSTNEINGYDEKVQGNRNRPTGELPETLDTRLTNLSVQTESKKASKDLKPLLDRMETLPHYLKDLMEALKSVNEIFR